MITSEQLQEYFAGRLTAGARERFEEELAGDPEVLRQWVEQEKLDAALRMLLGRPGRSRVMASIVAVIRSEAAAEFKADVLRDLRADPRQKRNRLAGLTEWLAVRRAVTWSAAMAAAALVVFGLFHWREPAAPAASGIAELVELRGRVVVTRDGTALEAANRFALRGGDSIRTDADADGVIQLEDGTRVVLGAGAAIALGGEDGKEMQLTAGRVAAEVARQPAGKHVVLRTPLAMVTVHGTTLALEATPGSTRLDVREGWVRMAHTQSDSELELTGGEFALAMPDRELLGGLQAVAVADKPAANDRGDRDPALWPFTATSPWNTAIGSQAAFAPVQSTGLDLAGRGLAVLPTGNDRALFIARPGDPEVPVLRRFGGGEWMRLRLAPEVMRDVPRALNCTVIDPQLGLAHELIMAGRAGEGVEAMLCHTNQLRGPGTPPEQPGHTSSGMPLMAGVIRKGEMQRGIRHVLAASVIHHGLSRSGNGGHPFVWPARHVPMETRKLEDMAASGNVHFGTLLAIPPDVDITKLGLGTDGPAFEIARALQDYGAYITHSYGRAPNDGQGWLQPHLQLFADSVPTAELGQLTGDVSKLAGHLRIVSNNTADSIGGGGLPRSAPAPGFRPAPLTSDP